MQTATANARQTTSKGERELKKERWALAAVLALAAALRLYRLGQLPNGFSPDEASYGYNGYSLLRTGRDRFGEWLPLFADNFGDLIAASYMWLTAPSIALFGLNEFAVRLPAALVGTATVWTTYKLGTEFRDRWVGLLAAFFLAISPWHIQISRYAERSPLLPLLFCLGLFFFLRWQRHKKNELLWSALAFAICLYSYASARVFVPLFVLGAALVYRKSLWAERRQVLIAVALFVLLALPAAYHWTSAEGMARAHYLLRWTPLAWLQNYLSYFSPNYLFLNGDANLRHSIRGMGQLHLFEMATIAAGLLVCARRRQRMDWLLALWLVLYQLPAALTEPGHAIRSIAGAPLFALLSGQGLHSIIMALGQRTPGNCRHRRIDYSDFFRPIWQALLCRLRRIRRHRVDVRHARGLCRNKKPPARAALLERRDFSATYIRALLHRISTRAIPARSAAQRAPGQVELPQLPLWQKRGQRRRKNNAAPVQQQRPNCHRRRRTPLYCVVALAAGPDDLCARWARRT